MPRWSFPPSITQPPVGIKVWALPRLRLEPPRFDGENAPDWIRKIQEYYNYHYTPLDDRLYLTQYLFDPPASDWREYWEVTNKGKSWDDFLLAVYHRFALELTEEDVTSDVVYNNGYLDANLVGVPTESVNEQITAKRLNRNEHGKEGAVAAHGKRHLELPGMNFEDIKEKSGGKAKNLKEGGVVDHSMVANEFNNSHLINLSVETVDHPPSPLGYTKRVEVAESSISLSNLPTSVDYAVGSIDSQSGIPMKHVKEENTTGSCNGGFVTISSPKATRTAAGITMEQNVVDHHQLTENCINQSNSVIIKEVKLTVDDLGGGDQSSNGCEPRANRTTTSYPKHDLTAKSTSSCKGCSKEFTSLRGVSDPMRCHSIKDEEVYFCKEYGGGPDAMRATPVHMESCSPMKVFSVDAELPLPNCNRGDGKFPVEARHVRDISGEAIGVPVVYDDNHTETIFYEQAVAMDSLALDATAQSTLDDATKICLMDQMVFAMKGVGHNMAPDSRFVKHIAGVVDGYLVHNKATHSDDPGSVSKSQKKCHCCRRVSRQRTSYVEGEKVSASEIPVNPIRHTPQNASSTRTWRPPPSRTEAEVHLAEVNFSSTFNWANLLHLDVSGNAFSGRFSIGLSCDVILRHLNLAHNWFKEQELLQADMLSGFEYLILSATNVIGENSCNACHLSSLRIPDLFVGLLFLAFGCQSKASMWAMEQSSSTEELTISRTFSFHTDSTTWVADVKQAKMVLVVIFQKPLLNFTFPNFMSATSHFDRDTLLAEGMFEPVYRGVFLEGICVAVKVSFQMKMIGHNDIKLMLLIAILTSTLRARWISTVGELIGTWTLVSKSISVQPSTVLCHPSQRQPEAFTSPIHQGSKT